MKILVADDDAVTRRLLQRTLERIGFEVVCAENGQNAAETLLDPNGPRIAILDWVMPGKDGPSVCRQIRAQADNPYVYLILLTSRETCKDVVIGLEAGADDYLIKPWNPEELSARVRTGQRILELHNKLTHEAEYDALTALPNRSFFAKRLAESIRRAQEDKEYQFTLLFADIDRFKTVNDSFGHIAGDELMKCLAKRFLKCVRTDRTEAVRPDRRNSTAGLRDVVARLGGDEFVFLLEDLANATAGISVAERIQSMLEPAFYVGGQEVFITASIGISASGGDPARASDILRDADCAMYKAKRRGKARYEVADPAEPSTRIDLFRLEYDLRKAIQKKEFEVHYQPIVGLGDCRITSLEALVRWRHPIFGLLPPEKFLPVAEEAGMMTQIGTFVLREACRQMHEWNATFASIDPAAVCVNISPMQFEPLKLVECVSEILHETGLNPRSLELEVTENLTMQDAGRATEILRELASIGISLSLDDFGTGYSSLSYLLRFPIRTLKIDRSFVAEIESSEESRTIVQTIIVLGHNLGMKVIAEGIEKAGQMELLKTFGCDMGQGYLFSRPVEADVVSAMMGARFLGGSLIPYEIAPGPMDEIALPMGMSNPTGQDLKHDDLIGTFKDPHSHAPRNVPRDRQLIDHRPISFRRVS
jgi:predicted signal transduction protein with EAL and GGDEF domain